MFSNAMQVALALILVANVHAQVGCPQEGLRKASCDIFALYARSSITFAGLESTIHTNNIVTSPGTTITGAYNLMDGVVTSPAEGADFAAFTILDHAEKAAVPATYMGMAVALDANIPYVPGVYRAGSTLTVLAGTTVILDGEGSLESTWIFQAGSTFIAEATSKVVLTNGARAENVIFVCGSAATIGVDADIAGSVLAGSTITFSTGAYLRGCGIAQTTITFAGDGHIDMT